MEVETRDARRGTGRKRLYILRHISRAGPGWGKHGS